MFGNVKLLRAQFNDQRFHYVVFLPDADAYDAFNQANFQKLRDQHWHIEQYQRMIKQMHNNEKFKVRSIVPIFNPIFAALCGYVHLQRIQNNEIIRNAYQWQKTISVCDCRIRHLFHKFVKGNKKIALKSRQNIIGGLLA